MTNIFFDIAIVVVVSAGLAWIALLSRQPVIIAYVVTGAILGPWGLKIVGKVDFINEVSHIGVTLLLFLAGLVLHPKRLMQLFKQTFLVTILSSLTFGAISALFVSFIGFSQTECIIVGLSMMFSSTILVVKLLPTTTLHHKHMGSLCIGVLIIQDLIAVLILMFLNPDRSGSSWSPYQIPLAFIALVGTAFIFEQYVLRRVIRQVDHYHEVLFLVALAWCFGLSVAAEKIGFSNEVGAFIAGLALARNPISLFFSEGLKFFRDFFLVLFFFTLGAKIDFLVVQSIILPALLLAVMLIVLKPLILMLFFRLSGETGSFSREIGIRLGQASEFSLIISVLAYDSGLIGKAPSQMIQFVAITTIILSSYMTVFMCPTPLGTRKTLKQD